MSRIRMAMLGLAAPLLILACDKPSSEATPSAQPPSTPPAATAANTATQANANANAQPSTAAAAAIPETDIVTAADFEDEAEKAITSKNYKAELTSLEAEVQKE